MKCDSLKEEGKSTAMECTVHSKLRKKLILFHWLGTETQQYKNIMENLLENAHGL